MIVMHCSEKNERNGKRNENEMERKGKMVIFIKTTVILLNERFFPTNILKKRSNFTKEQFSERLFDEKTKKIDGK